MTFEKGSVVRSRAGRDKGSFFAIIEVDGPYCLIVDGKNRKLVRPKKKKQIHLSATNSKLDESDFASDRRLREALACFNE